MDEQALVARAREGDAGAFESLVTLHQDRIYNLLYRLCGNDADASDLSQDVFFKAWKALPGFQGGAQFGSWLYQIALNAARSRGRHLSVVKRVSPVSRNSGGPEGGEIELPDRSADRPEASLERREQVETAQRMLLSLEPDLREAIVLREIEGLSYAEIASAQGVPVGTAKTRVHRARLELREKMSESPERAGGMSV